MQSPVPQQACAADVMLELLLEIGACQRRLRAQLDEGLRAGALGYTELLVLWLCGREPESGRLQKDLAIEAGVSAAQMSGVVEGLRQRGLLVGVRGLQDRRQQYWHLSAEGRRLLDEMRRLVSVSFQPLRERFPVEEERRLRGLLQQVRTASDWPRTLGLFVPDPPPAAELPASGAAS
jgi:DNA-binding MarR family transcriptional regulator